MTESERLTSRALRDASRDLETEPQRVRIKCAGCNRRFFCQGRVVGTATGIATIERDGIAFRTCPGCAPNESDYGVDMPAGVNVVRVPGTGIEQVPGEW